MTEKTFVFCSPLALEEPLFRAAELIARHHGLEGHVIAPEDYEVPAVHHPSGRLGPEAKPAGSGALRLHFLPARGGDVQRFGFEERALFGLLGKLAPASVWIHAEFWQGIARQFLRHYRLRRSPSIVAYVAVNDVTRPLPLFRARWPFLSRTRLAQILLWGRLDGVAACAAKSAQCARRMGLPPSVLAAVNYLPVLGPEEGEPGALRLPWRRDEAFTVGFAGLLSEQKGWKVLLAALERLPDRFRAVMVGDGEQREELQARVQRSPLRSRAFYAGVLTRRQLLGAYRQFDAFALPAVTMPGLAEQFGCVLAEAMACGVPVIGSDSGAIPETVGDAGLVVPEGDPDALARAIVTLSGDRRLRRALARRGRERYQALYSCEAYARSMASLLRLPPRCNARTPSQPGVGARQPVVARQEDAA